MSEEKEKLKNLPDCTGCTDPDSWDLPEGRTHQLGTKQHPYLEEKKEKELLGAVKEIVQKEIAKADEHEIAPLQRIMAGLIEIEEVGK